MRGITDARSQRLLTRGQRPDRTQCATRSQEAKRDPNARRPLTSPFRPLLPGGWRRDQSITMRGACRAAAPATRRAAMASAMVR